MSVKQDSFYHPYFHSIKIHQFLCILEFRKEEFCYHLQIFDSKSWKEVELVARGHFSLSVDGLKRQQLIVVIINPHCLYMNLNGREETIYTEGHYDLYLVVRSDTFSWNINRNSSFLFISRVVPNLSASLYGTIFFINHSKVIQSNE